MPQQPRTARPNETEPKSLSAVAAEQQPQTAPRSEEADLDHIIADTTQCGWIKRLFSFLIWALIILSVIVLWLALLYIAISSSDFKWNDLSILGQLGDSFGTLNTLFSGLAFLGIIISIKLQRDDLKLQRVELSRQYNEMKSQRELAEEYQNERFFVLLLEQVKGQLIIDKKVYLVQTLDTCYTDIDEDFGYIKKDTNRQQIQQIINDYYKTTPKNKVKKEYCLTIDEFVSRITIKCKHFQPLFDRVTHIYEFIMSLSDEKTRTNYARIAYNNIGLYDRIIIFMYFVAKHGLRQGDIFGDLMYSDFEKLGPI